MLVKRNRVQAPIKARAKERFFSIQLPIIAILLRPETASDGATVGTDGTVKLLPALVTVGTESWLQGSTAWQRLIEALLGVCRPGIAVEAFNQYRHVLRPVHVLAVYSHAPNLLELQTAYDLVVAHDPVDRVGRSLHVLAFLDEHRHYSLLQKQPDVGHRVDVFHGLMSGDPWMVRALEFGKAPLHLFRQFTLELLALEHIPNVSLYLRYVADIFVHQDGRGEKCIEKNDEGEFGAFFPNPLLLVEVGQQSLLAYRLML
mmetsp:Transcript_66641/g.145295  ORF Transcript_66641/g.145295 Transcript_66641/m.145295 type:complete len:259 (+) Transcript_66641:861-1637(+)